MNLLPQSSALRLLIVAIGVYAGYSFYKPRVYHNPANVTGDTCVGRTFCAVIYLAPWCPHCVNSMAETQNMLVRFRTPELGVRVVVGMGSQAENTRMAEKIAAGVTLDENQAIAKHLAVNSVPAYRILDKDGTVILTGQEAFHWLQEKYRN